MRISSSHSFSDRAADAYFSPPEAVMSLLKIERIPNRIWEPACGDGAIVKPLRESGRDVIASDVIDYGLPGCVITDYLHAPRADVDGIITNPPYKYAIEFVSKAISEVEYAAFLLRLNFLESTRRKPFFEKKPPARVWVSSRRLPMMHRHGWTGPEAPSNTCMAWFVWDSRSRGSEIKWFDWAELLQTQHAGKLV